MTSLYLALKRLVRDEKGQGMVEYGLIIALVSIVVIGVLGTMGTDIGQLFTRISTTIQGTLTP